MAPITKLHQIDLQRGRITKPRWSPNGRLIALPTESGSILIFDMTTGQVSQKLGPHSGAVISACWDRESELIMTGSLDGSIGVWELKSGKRAPFTPGGHKQPVHSVDWTDEGAYAMTCSSDRVRAWDGFCLQDGWTAAMEAPVNEITGFTAASCSYQTSLLLGIAAENGALLRLVSLVSADFLDSVRVDDPVLCLAWSPKEDLLMAGTTKRILAFRVDETTGFQGHPGELTKAASQVHALAFSGNGTLLASRDAEGLKVWDLKTAKLIAALDENTEALSNKVSGISFHPTKPLLAAAAPNGNEFSILDLSNLARS
jgi:WD40 repeat protein